MEDFPSNTRSDQDARKTKMSRTGGPAAKMPAEPEKRVKKAVVSKGDVVRKKKPLGRRMSETFFGGDARSVAGFVFMDVLVPATKDLIVDMVTQGIERSLYGEVRGQGRRSPAGRPGSRDHTPYSRISSGSSRRDPREEPRLTRRSRARHEFEDVILPSRVKAEEVLDGLYDILSKYEQVSVADFYDLLDETSEPVDEKWGWEDLRGSSVIRRRDGYLINIPSPEPLV